MNMLPKLTIRNNEFSCSNLVQWIYFCQNTFKVHISKGMFRVIVYSAFTVYAAPVDKLYNKTIHQLNVTCNSM